MAGNINENFCGLQTKEKELKIANELANLLVCNHFEFKKKDINRLVSIGSGMEPEMFSKY